MESGHKVRLAFFSVVLNHHQVHLADEMWRRLNHDYLFVELISGEGEGKGDSSDYTTRPYLLQAWKDSERYDMAMSVARSADICVFASSESLPFQIERLKKGLLTFEMSERWLKRGLLSFMSRRLLANQLNYHIRRWKNKQLYKLCCSAYAADDQYLMRSFVDKCYKWGYFTGCHDLDIDNCIEKKRNDRLSLMWCGRFVGFKHPEIPVRLAYLMKQNGLDFQIDMYGDGPLKPYIESMVRQSCMSDYISFKGAVDNVSVQSAMQEHHVFLLTSDKREGWGVVANEAMNNGCLLVASDKVGSVPYLVKDMETGVTFADGDVVELYSKLCAAIGDRPQMENMIRNAYSYIRKVWSYDNAANNFLSLCATLMKGDDLQIFEGPCSKSFPIRNGYER